MTREGGRYIVAEEGGEPIKADTAENPQAKPAPETATPAQLEAPRPDKKKVS